MSVSIFTILVVILFSSYSIIFIKSYFTNRKQWKQAIPVEAKIVSIGDEVYDHQCHGDDFYEYVFTATQCKVSFYVNAMEHVQDAKIEKRKRELQVGDLVEIRYYCNVKQEIEIVDEAECHKSFGNMLVGMFFLVGMLFIFLKYR